MPMKSRRQISAELQQTEKDIEHFAELQAMKDLNQGHSPVRDKTMNEIQRLLLEKRATLRWVLGLTENE